jgi:hypothetical protein
MEGSTKLAPQHTDDMPSQAALGGQRLIHNKTKLHALTKSSANIVSSFFWIIGD